MSDFEGTTKCPRCGSSMKLKSGTRGLFFSCTNFPTCRGTRPAPTLPAQESLPATGASPSAATELVAALKQLTIAVDTLTTQLKSRPIAAGDDDTADF